MFALGGGRLPWFVFGALAVLLVPVFFWFLRRRPPTSSSALTGRRAAAAGATLRQAWRTPSLWMILAGATICGYTTRTFWTYVVPAGIEGGASSTQAALALSLAGLMNVPGLLASGAAVDRMSRQKWLAILFALRALAFLGMVLFLRTGQLPMLFAAAALAGFVSRATGTAFQSLLVNCYGVRSLGSLSGVETMFHQTAAAAGAIVGGLIFDATDSYTAALLVSAALLVVGIVVSLRIPERRFYAVPEAAGGST
ncbi:MAG: MFS transporter [Chloroflexota bacterium]